MTGAPHCDIDNGAAISNAAAKPKERALVPVGWGNIVPESRNPNASSRLPRHDRSQAKHLLKGSSLKYAVYGSPEIGEASDVSGPEQFAMISIDHNRPFSFLELIT